MFVLKGLLMLSLLSLSAQHLLALPVEENFNWGALEAEVSQAFTNDFKAKAQNQPILILIGGFQGAGKSSLLARLTEIYDANVISTDAIRQSLFNRGVTISPEFSKCVSGISGKLLKNTLAANANLFIDANAHTRRIGEVEGALKLYKSPYTTVEIFLKTSEEVLRHRVRERNARSDCYQGTEEDLEAALSSIKVNPEDYDLVVDTDKLNENSVFELLNQHLTSYFKLQTHL